MKKIRVTVTKIDGPLYSGEADSVTVPTEGGMITLLADHEPLIAPIRKGKVVILSDGEQHVFNTEIGTLEVSSNLATILL